MADPLVLRHDDGGVATLTLNRPEKLNALNPAMFVALRRHVEALAAADGIGCVVLNGAGRAFSAGHDLGAIASREPAPSRHYEPETIDLLEALPKPTIAKIRGPRACRGSGRGACPARARPRGAGRGRTRSRRVARLKPRWWADSTGPPPITETASRTTC